jgi:hypothetical protein
VFDLGLIFGTPARFFRAFDEEFDPAASVGIPIQLEMQLRNMPEGQADAQFVTQVVASVVQGGEGGFLLPLVAP